MNNDINEIPLIEELRAKRPQLAARAAAGNTLASIRLNCLECSGGSALETAACVSERCSLWPFRLGRNTLRAKRVLTEEQRQAVAERFRAMRAAGVETVETEEPEDDEEEEGEL